MKAARNKKQRGFALMIVMVVVALLAVAAITQLCLIVVDLNIVGHNKRSADALAVADGAVMEVIDDQRAASFLPDFTTPQLSSTYTPSPGSAFVDPWAGQNYTAGLKLLRFVPLTESSRTWSHALIYEVDALGDSSNGEGSAEIRSQIFKTVALAPGIILPRIHAR
jgi:hypothetical protein